MDEGAQEQPKWGALLSSLSDTKFDKTEKSPTIIVSQPTRRTAASPKYQMTDEYLDSILPKVGYKIILPPSNYTAQKRIQEQERELKAEPQLPVEFASYFNDKRPDEELTPEEQKSRFITKLLLQIKDGTVYQRKMALRILTNNAPKLGASAIFAKLVPLLESNILSPQERHTFTKVVDRLMYRLSDSLHDYSKTILNFAAKSLSDRDAVTRGESKEIIAHLAKITGLMVILKELRQDLDNTDKGVREAAAQTIAVSAASVGADTVLPFLRASIKTKKSWRIRETALRIVKALAVQLKNGVLAILTSLVDILLSGLEDEEQSVVESTYRSIEAVADASSPYGGRELSSISEKIFGADIRNTRSRVFLKAAGSLLTTMNESTAGYQFKRLSPRLSRWFDSQNNEDKLTALIVFHKSLPYVKDCGTEIMRGFLRSFWQPFSGIEGRFTYYIASVSIEIAKRYSVANVVRTIFADFDRGSTEFRRLAIDTFTKICKECSIVFLDDRTIIRIIESLIYAFDDAKDNDERRDKAAMKCISSFASALDDRVEILLDEVISQVEKRIEVPKQRRRQQAADLLAIFTPYMSKYGRIRVVKYYYGILHELLDSEYPSVLSSVLDALRTMIGVIPTQELSPGPSDLLANLLPVMKNRQEKVAYACVQLVAEIAKIKDTNIDKKEWMRICFELLELFKAERKKVRTAAVHAFSGISSAIGPFDVLLVLLNNLQVQERQIRHCTTLAIAVLAENSGPYNILPALMNEYRTPDANVQTGSLKALQYLFQALGPQIGDYAYSLVPLLTHALIERDPIHRQLACATVCQFAIGCYAEGKEDALIHLLNHLIPNIFETTLHFIDATMDALDAMRLSLGPGVVLQYILAGLFHPARKVRSQYWRVYNNLVIYSGDQLVPYYPLLQDTESNTYHRHELDVYI